ncbi:NAD(P)-binding protein [Xylaria palmicola]|nr:NAD(P)-binding protein [Xylaria palmicola]
MPVIAVAGGTGGIGRSIVEEILATKKHEVKILSRQPNPALEASIGAAIIGVDYSNVEALTHVLEANNVHTLISTLTFRSQEGVVSPDGQLVLAADASKPTKRYVSNNWGVPVKEGDELRMPPQAFKVEVLRALKQATDLEYTSFYTGIFLDYYSMPAVKSHMKPTVLVIDVAHAAASIPGTGDTPISFTHTTDVAKYVAAALDLDRWESAYNLSADKVTWKEFLSLAERVRGTKFAVAYDDLEKLEAGNITELPGQAGYDLSGAGAAVRKFLAAGNLLMESGHFDINEGESAKKVFPWIKPKTVKSLLEEAWKEA